ncbi:alcohol dehydrogenase catalytic domain-containing protein [Microbacterium sp. G2-8]|uniref:alcohol dehydrogenase catalytic domain-containing protein n=1 Tax=Microbacterium sp. G2-8 TaxID=2842454 RepID=UPI001C8A99F0|nr:alcohol dehydrogenase catalytic domain-containing protein [Microbacterium sp. G2-8]
MTATHAAVMRAAKTISLEDLDVGEIREDEVLVRIESAGICATDIEILDEGFDQLATPPVVLGHEGAHHPLSVAGSAASRRSIAVRPWTAR